MRKNRIHFIDYRGRNRSEYIPSVNQFHLNWLREKYVYWRVALDRDIYYWHIRHRIEPRYRKVFDLELVHHVIKEHAGRAEINYERRHFWLAWSYYGYEQRFLAREFAKAKMPAKSEAIMNSYNRKWIFGALDPEIKLLFHGLKWPDFNIQLERIGDYD